MPYALITMKPTAYGSYKDLIVYQKAKSLTTDIISFFSKNRIPRTLDFLINQLFRAISSVGANIAEGYGRHYEGSLKQFYAIARGSSFESDYWLEVINNLNMFDKNSISNFSDRNVELSKMLTSLMKKIK